MSKTPEQLFEDLIDPVFDRIRDAGYTAFMVSFHGGQVALTGAVGSEPPDRSTLWFALGALMAKYGDPGAEHMEAAARCIETGYTAQRDATAAEVRTKDEQ